jgi:hypothetical protein
MTGLELSSILLGIVLLSIYLSGLIVNGLGLDDDFYSRVEPRENSHLFLKLFVLWLFIHIFLSLNFTVYERVNSISKSNVVYYLDQYKSSDLVLDKETYDRLKAMGNEDKLYTDQSFWVTTIDKDNKVHKYSISGEYYKYLKEYRVKDVEVKYDTWGNRKSVY